MIPDVLPKPSQHGTFWFGKPPDAPAVFQGGGPEFVDGAPRDRKRWFASLGGNKGPLMDGNEIRYFDNPQAALDALREAHRKAVNEFART